jgi:dipeptide/tripeptide permease
VSERSRRRDKNHSAYAQAVTSLVIVLLLHMFLFCFMFDLVEYLPYGEKSFWPSGFGTELSIMAAAVLVIVLINICFKEKDVLKIQMGEREKRRGYIILMVYVVLLFISIIILPFMKKGLM